MNNNITIGMDLGDKSNQICVLNVEGEVIKTDAISNTKCQIEKYFKEYAGATIAIEVGTHSPWISRCLTKLGLKVLVGNSRKLRMIWDTPNKSDVKDAEMLARVARFDKKLLYPIHHRSEEAHIDLQIIKSREALVNVRAGLINHIRGTVKAFGLRISSCSSTNFYKRALAQLPKELIAVLGPVIKTLGRLNAEILNYEKKIEKLSRKKYPETDRLRAIHGVGPVTALAFILTLENPNRFEKSRTVGAFLGLTPKRDQSGKSDKQLGISKAGNEYLRKLLVVCSNYIMGPLGKDCELRRFGEKINSRGGRKTKQIAKVAVARKLAVLMHSLWKNESDYNPWLLKEQKKICA